MRPLPLSGRPRKRIQPTLILEPEARIGRVDQVIRPAGGTQILAAVIPENLPLQARVINSTEAKITRHSMKRKRETNEQDSAAKRHRITKKKKQQQNTAGTVELSKPLEEFANEDEWCAELKNLRKQWLLKWPRIKSTDAATQQQLLLQLAGHALDLDTELDADPATLEEEGGEKETVRRQRRTGFLETQRVVLLERQRTFFQERHPRVDYVSRPDRLSAISKQSYGDQLLQLMRRRDILLKQLQSQEESKAQQRKTDAEVDARWVEELQQQADPLLGQLIQRYSARDTALVGELRALRRKETTVEEEEEDAKNQNDKGVRRTVRAQIAMHEIERSVIDDRLTKVQQAAEESEDEARLAVQVCAEEGASDKFCSSTSSTYVDTQRRLEEELRSELKLEADDFEREYQDTTRAAALKDLDETECQNRQLRYQTLFEEFARRERDQNQRGRKNQAQSHQKSES